MNGRYMRELPVDELHRRLEGYCGREIPLGLVEISREKMQTLADFMPLAGPLMEPPTEYEEKAWRQWGTSPHLPAIRAALAAAPTWDVLALEPTGTTVSPGIFESVVALGREETLERLDKALRKAK